MAVIKPLSEKKRTGRLPHPDTPKKLEKVKDAIALGIPYEIAAVANGISERYLYECIQQGNIDISEGDINTPHARLAQGLREIEMKTIASCLADIRPAEKGHRGAEWILERRFWKHFSPNISVMELTKEIEELKRLMKIKSSKEGK